MESEYSLASLEITVWAQTHTVELGDDFIIQYRSLKTAICIALFSFVKLDLYFDIGNYIITPGVKNFAGIATI